MSNIKEIECDTRNIRNRKAKKFPSKKEKSIKLKYKYDKMILKEKNKSNNIENNDNNENIKTIENKLDLLVTKRWYRNSRHHRHCLYCNGSKYLDKKRKKNYEKEETDFSIYDYNYRKK